jgi:hypothetical protein
MQLLALLPAIFVLEITHQFSVCPVQIYVTLRVLVEALHIFRSAGNVPGISILNPIFTHDDLIEFFKPQDAFVQIKFVLN